MLDFARLTRDRLLVRDSSHSPAFTVQVEGYLVADGVWQIDACLCFPHGHHPEPGDPLLGQGRLALVKAIVAEGERGRALGATSVRLHMEVEGRTATLGSGDGFESFGTIH